MMTAFSLALSSLLILASAPPSREEKVAAIATVVKTWRAHPKGSQAEENLATVVAMLVLEAAGARDPMSPTPDEQKNVPGVVRALKAIGADPSEAVDVLLQNVREGQCASMQLEAKGSLMSILVFEKDYFAQNGRYERDLKKVGFEPLTAVPRYTFEVVSADKKGFKARAVGLGEAAGEEWEIDSATATPRAVKNLCSR